MALIKTKEEIETMKISGKISALALKKVLEQVKPGVSCIDLDQTAKEVVESQGAQPSFATVDDYKWTTCLTLNNQVVHGIPTQRRIKDGDILSIDLGALYRGFHSDMAITVPVGQISKSLRQFLAVGKKSLELAISQAKIGNRIGDISATLQRIIEGAGYSVVKSLTGHGIGRHLHEEPTIAGFGQRGHGPKIVAGMTLAIEAIYAQGSGEVFVEADGWTISTQDGSLSALFEKTIAVTDNGPIVLTPYL